MANYNTLSSTMIDLKQEQVDWALGLYDALVLYVDELEDIDEIAEPFQAIVQEFYEEWVGFRAARSDGELWIYADETCTPEHIAWFIREILIRFNIGKGVVFSWANTCTKPRPDSFSGGACFVTAYDEQWFVPDFQAMMAEHKHDIGTVAYYMERIRALIKRGL